MAKYIPQAVQYLSGLLQADRLTTIIDVGANPINEAPYSEMLRAGQCQIVGFEPQEAAYRALLKRQAANELYYPHAVGDGKPATLRIYASQGLTSIFDPDLASMALLGKSRWTQVKDKVEFETVALDAVEGLPPCDALKIDIQGGETLVFDGARRVLAEATVVIVELRYLRLYENEPMMQGVHAALLAQGFQLHRFMFNKSMPLANSQSARFARRYALDQLVDGDAVYLRDLTRLHQFSRAQLTHLAMLAAAVFGSHTLVAMVLDELTRRGALPEGAAAGYVDALPAEYRSEPAA